MKKVDEAMERLGLNPDKLVVCRGEYRPMRVLVINALRAVRRGHDITRYERELGRVGAQVYTVADVVMAVMAQRRA